MKQRNEFTEDAAAVLEKLFDQTVIFKSHLDPADWFDGRISMPANASIPGKVRYANTPYWREVVNRFSPYDPATDITIKGPAQMGKTFMVLFPIITYTIEQNPCNIMLLTGHSELTGDTIVELDKVIDELGIRHLLQPSTQKTRNNRTGDTSTKKEFSGFAFRAGSVTNHNLLRFYNAMIMLVDDLDAAKQSGKDTGSTVELVKGRTKSYEGRRKHGWISTPQTKGSSLIQSQFELGDQRYFYIPCSNRQCGKMITLDWKIFREDESNSYGLRWKLDKNGLVDPNTVHYICPHCGGGFNERNKRWFLNEGIWQPTQIPKERDHYSYSINGLYAGLGMTSWTTLIGKYLACSPSNQPRLEDKYQTFINIDIGDVYEPPGTDLKASQLMSNIRRYKVGTVPEKQSMADGNGRIVILTLTADLGGLMSGYNAQHDDVRLDYEVVAWSESGSRYSVTQGSIGSFTPAHMGKRDEARELWTYDISRPNNVWRLFDQIVKSRFLTDTGRELPIAVTGIDTGFAEHHVWNYIERANAMIIGLKGDKDHKYTTFGDNSASWRVSPNRADGKLFLLKVSKLKDQLAQLINLRWDKTLPAPNPQPPGFLNFPEPENGQYDLERYFMHFEAEERKTDKNGNWLWMKKQPNAQNHFFDVAIYHMAVKEILMENVMKDLKRQNPSWPEFADWVLSMVPPMK